MACIRKVEELSTDPEFIGYYDIEESHRQDINDSYNTGYDEGKKEEKIEIAKNLLKQNIPMENISQATGLSIEELSRL